MNEFKLEAISIGVAPHEPKTVRLVLLKYDPAERTQAGHYPATWSYGWPAADDSAVRDAVDSGRLPVGGYYRPGQLVFNQFARRDRGFTRPQLVYWRKLKPSELLVSL